MPCDFYVSISIFVLILPAKAKKEKKRNPGKHLLVYVYSTD